MKFNVNKLSASSRLQPDLITLKLNNLSLERPELEFDGNFIVAQTTPKLNLRLGTHVPDLIEVIPFVRPLMAQVTDSTLVFDSILSGSLTDISMQSEANTISDLFDLEAMRLDTRLEGGEFFLSRLLHRVENVSGRLRVADRRVELTDAHIESGRSVATIEKAAVYRKNDKAPFMLEINNNRIHFDLSALHKNLSQFPALQKGLEEISSVSGQLDFNIANLHGPLAEITEWQFKATGAISEAIIATQRFPAPVALHSGSYAMEPRHFTFKDIQVKAMDSNLKLSGAVLGGLTSPSHIWASVTGKVSSKSINWVHVQINQPNFMPVVTPLTIHQSTLSWKKGNNITAKGAISLLNGPEFAGDMSFSPPKNLQVALSSRLDTNNRNI